MKKLQVYIGKSNFSSFEEADKQNYQEGKGNNYNYNDNSYDINFSQNIYSIFSEPSEFVYVENEIERDSKLNKLIDSNLLFEKIAKNRNSHKIDVTKMV